MKIESKLPEYSFLLGGGSCKNRSVCHPNMVTYWYPEFVLGWEEQDRQKVFLKKSTQWGIEEGFEPIYILNHMCSNPSGPHSRPTLHNLTVFPLTHLYAGWLFPKCLSIHLLPHCGTTFPRMLSSAPPCQLSKLLLTTSCNQVSYVSFVWPPFVFSFPIFFLPIFWFSVIVQYWVCPGCLANSYK